MIGKQLGAYQILSKLGEGGMGEVYRATDTHLKRQAAVKVLPASVGADPDRLARFQREAEVLAALNHPHIAAVYGLEKTPELTALVMELVDGDDLSERIARGPLPIAEALAIARQIAEALEAAHEQGIIHRDLKPANVKVRDDGTVKVLDFGLAKAMDPASGSGRQAPGSGSFAATITSPAMMTGVGVILGTAAYMAPEQAKGRAVDKRADIWAFGVVLFEMLTGARAFHGEDITDVVAAVMKDTPDWSALPADVPPHIVTLIQRCLEKDRKTRIGDIAVARFLLAEGGVLSRQSASAAAAPRPVRLRGLPWIAAALFLLTTAGVSFIHFREAPPPPLKSIRFDVSSPENISPTHFRFSPDGRRLVFRGYGTTDGKSLLWVRSMDSASAAPLPGTDGAIYPFWSPDGSQIGFFAQGKLKKIPAAGGLAVALCDVVNGRGGAWSRNGVILFAPDAFGGLYRVPEAGGTPVVATTISAPSGDRFPELLPDDQHFVFLRIADKDGGIYVGSLSDASVTRVLPDPSNATYVPGFLLFRRENTLMAQPFDAARLQTTGGVVPVAEQVGVGGNTGFGAFTSSRDGTVAFRPGLIRTSAELVWLDRAGKRLGGVSKPGEITFPALAPDGKVVVFGLGDFENGQSDLWLQHLESGVLSKFTFGSGVSSGPVWSPNGSRIALTNTSGAPSPSVEIQLRALSGATRPEVLLHGSYNSLRVTDWSRDGKRIVFNSRSESTKDDTWLLPLDGDRKAIPFVQTPANENEAQFSPDGAWLAYTSDQSGRPEVYVQHVPPNGFQTQISSAGGRRASWSRDGRELFYQEGTESTARFMSVPVTIGATFERGLARPLFDGLSLSSLSPLQPTADGQRFLALVPTEGEQRAPITVITNWHPASKP